MEKSFHFYYDSHFPSLNFRAFRQLILFFWYLMDYSSHSLFHDPITTLFNIFIFQLKFFNLDHVFHIQVCVYMGKFSGRYCYVFSELLLIRHTQ